MARFKHTAHKVSLTAMFATMTLLFLYLSSIIPVLRITLYFFSSVFVMGLLLEEEVSFALIMFVGVSLLSLVLMPFTRALPYMLFFGHYGIGKYIIEKNIKDKIVRYVIKLLYYNIAVFFIYLLAREFFVEDVLSTGLPLWVVIVIAEVAFVVYDFIYTKVTGYYFNNIRRMLIKN